MRFRVAAGTIMLTLMTNAAPSLSLHRLIVVVGQPDDVSVRHEMAMLARAQRALGESDVVVQSLSPEAARHDRPELGVAATTTFEVLLVGEDGSVKWRRQRPVDPSEIAGLIDTTPMRRQEMKR
jgi:hypothetical protein